jgi:hypothetical protein
MQVQKLVKFAQLALDGVHREYPYHLTHVVHERGTLESPRSLTPAFYGCFDWHSAVHGHWLLALASRHLGDSTFATRCKEALAANLTKEHLQAERDNLMARPGFERPYGLAWLLMLDAELKKQEVNPILQLRSNLQPLVEVAADQFRTWLPKLTHPMRSGTHNQTAFAMALAWDWAATVNDEGMTALLSERAKTFFGADRDYALHLEPGGEDFLSPSLGASWLMARVLNSEEFETWLDHTMNNLGRDFVFDPVLPSDRSDGRLCHLDGLNLSRAWMLHTITDGLPAGDDRIPNLARSAKEHQDAGMMGLQNPDYSGSHWLGTFAAYLHLCRDAYRDTCPSA